MPNTSHSRNCYTLYSHDPAQIKGTEFKSILRHNPNYCIANELHFSAAHVVYTTLGGRLLWEH
jgi:hypothetical protein